MEPLLRWNVHRSWWIICDGRDAITSSHFVILCGERSKIKTHGRLIGIMIVNVSYFLVKSRRVEYDQGKVELHISELFL